MNDGELLSQYRAQGSESAFGELVARHLGLVRGVARRTLGDDTAADDVAMRVFAIVARKAAALADRPSLGGWLVVAARQEALRAVRRESNRAAAMKRYAEANTEAPDAAAWQDAQPHLDEALAGLSDRDREAVMLRFYENQGFREIGQALGRGEDAARKRVASALEKLSASLRRRGTVLPAAALAAGLAGQLGNSAQAAGAGRVTAGALAAKASAGGVAAAFSGASLLTGAAGVLAAAACWWGGHTAGVRHARGVKPQPIVSSPASLRTPAVRAPGVAAPPLDPTGRTPLEIAAELFRLHDAQQSDAATALIAALPPDQCAAVLASCDAEFSYNSRRHRSVVHPLVAHWAERDPAGGVKHLAARMGTAPDLWDARIMLCMAVEEWARQDSAGCTTWLAAQQFPLRLSVSYRITDSEAWRRATRRRPSRNWPRCLRRTGPRRCARSPRLRTHAVRDCSSTSPGSLRKPHARSFSITSPTGCHWSSSRRLGSRCASRPATLHGPSCGTWRSAWGQRQAWILPGKTVRRKRVRTSSPPSWCHGRSKSLTKPAHGWTGAE